MESRSRRMVAAALTSAQPAATTNGIAHDEQPQTSTFADSHNFINPCTSKTLAINQLDLQPQPSTSGIQLDLQPQPSTSGIQLDLQPQPSTSGIQLDLQPQPSTSGIQLDLQPQPSTSGIQLESIPGIPDPADFQIDFSDDDSVADPMYVPNSDFDESSISDIMDINCEDIFNNDNTLNDNTLHCIDNPSLEQITQERILHNAENTKQILVAKYPGPIYITNSLTNPNIFKNKNMLKHPMIDKSCDGKCRRRCLEFSFEDKLTIWEEYWNAKFQSRRGFLNKFVQFSDIKRRKVHTNQSTTNSTYSRNETRRYYLPGKDNNVIPVCKRFFLNTLGLRTDGVITELSKAVRKGQLFASMTGENRGGKRKVIDRNLIQKHILGYNPAVSHYRRHNSPFTRYLPRELTVRQMHLDFKKKHPQEQCSEETYRKEIKKMKISFNMPRGDKCDECFLYSENKKIYSDESQIPDDIKQKYAVHKAKSDQALENYKNDATKINSRHVKYFSMDLQKVILLPIMPQIKEAVFISRLITFNLTFAPINKQSPDLATCIIWHEGQAGREASNIVDAIFTFIKNNRDCQHFHIWADNCTAQNKNWTLFTALTTIVNINLPVETLTLSYLTKGHTHMTADSVHGNIERKIKKQGDVLDFEDFKDVVLRSRQNIQVVELNDCKNWPKKKRTARKNDDEDLMKSFLLSQVVQVKFVAGSRNILYKTSFDEPFAELDFLPKKFKVTELPKEISGPRGIPTRKKDIIVAKLVPLMPETRRMFWNQMPVNDESIDLQTEGDMPEET